MLSFNLPTTNGWSVEWYTGEVRTIHYKNGRTKEVRQKKSYETTSKADAEAKAQQLEAEGFEIEGIYECIF